MPEITVWTKQNKAVLDQLNHDGRFIADEWYIRRELDETTDIMLFIYRWLADNMPAAAERPDDVSFPVWVSLLREATMIPEPGYVILELRLPEDKVTRLDAAKWTIVSNYSYIPLDEADAERHRKIMSDMGLSDARAVMTQFYPDVKQKIIESWDRLFDDSIKAPGFGSGDDDKAVYYGLLWEVKSEWVQKVIE